MKNIYVTEIRAIDPMDGELKTWAGPNIEAICYSEAEHICQTRLGYCKVTGMLVSEIPCKSDSLEPDFKNRTDYDTNLN